jgi:hypothetical protein
MSKLFGLSAPVYNDRAGPIAIDLNRKIRGCAGAMILQSHQRGTERNADELAG